MGKTNVYDYDELNRVFEKTDGYCYYCDKHLSFLNYGHPDGRGSWEIDHIVPLSAGGVDNRRNRVTACFSCNRLKGSMLTRQFRRMYFDEGSGGGSDIGGALLVLGGLALLGWLAGQRR